MIFNSLQFFFFICATLLVFHLFKTNYRWFPLLIAGFIFYALFSPAYLLLLLISILIDYIIAIRIHKATSHFTRKLLLLTGLIHNLGLLIFFKYFNFLNSMLLNLFKNIHISYQFTNLKWLVPVGISYYTFKKIAYLVDVYRQILPPQSHIGKFALFVSFFPSVVSGPIDRAQPFFSQLTPSSEPYQTYFTDGLKLILWGFFKKLVIADNLASIVNTVYSAPRDYEGPQFIIATLFFSIQVFCDFSGYTDIALGTARLFRIKLMNNFDHPYSAISITDFWRRWHISLSQWLRDYLFLPIAYRVSGKIKSPRFLALKPEVFSYLFATSITMILCGIWHGAKWTFVIWGTLHGLYLCLSFITKKLRKRIRKLLKINPHWSIYKKFQVTLTFLGISFLWIFFRANTLDDAWYIVTRLFTGTPQYFAQILSFLRSFTLQQLPTILSAQELGAPNLKILISIISISIMLFIHKRQNATQTNNDTPFAFLAKKNIVFKWGLIYLLFFWILLFGKFDEVQFIYIQF